MAKKSDKDLFPVKRSGKSSTKKDDDEPITKFKYKGEWKTLGEIADIVFEAGKDQMKKDVLKVLDGEFEILEQYMTGIKRSEEGRRYFREGALGAIHRIKKRVEGL